MTDLQARLRALSVKWRIANALEAQYGNAVYAGAGVDQCAADLDALLGALDETEATHPQCPLCRQPLESTGWLNAPRNSRWRCVTCEKEIEISPYEWPATSHAADALVHDVPEMDQGERVVDGAAGAVGRAAPPKGRIYLMYWDKAVTEERVPLSAYFDDAYTAEQLCPKCGVVLPCFAHQILAPGRAVPPEQGS